MVDVVTNGTYYYRISEDIASGQCNHLPILYSLVWGNVRHSKLATFLRQSNTIDIASDYVDLVYDNSDAKPKVVHYIIFAAQAVGPNWGQ